MGDLRVASDTGLISTRTRILGREDVHNRSFGLALVTK